MQKDILVRDLKTMLERVSQDDKITLRNAITVLENMYCNRNLYPYNLLSAININLDILTEDQKNGVSTALTMIPLRERNVLLKIYKESCTLENVAIKLSISKERVRQIKEQGLKHLQNEDCRNLMFFGLNGSREKARNVETVLPKEIDFLDKSIEILEISPRTINTLHRNGIDSVRALSEISYDEFAKINHLGEKSRKEIISCLNLHNVPHALRKTA